MYNALRIGSKSDARIQHAIHGWIKDEQYTRTTHIKIEQKRDSSSHRLVAAGKETVSRIQIGSYKYKANIPMKKATSINNSQFSFAFRPYVRELFRNRILNRLNYLNHFNLSHEFSLPNFTRIHSQTFPHIHKQN